jgi:hypothetical protein
VFSISSLTTISEIQGFMQVGGAGTLAVSLHAGSPAGPLLVLPFRMGRHKWLELDGHCRHLCCHLWLT